MASLAAPPVLKPLVVAEMNPPLNVKLVTDEAGLQEVASFLQRVQTFGLDVETNVVDDFYYRRLRTIQLGDRNEQYVIDMLKFAGSTESLYNSQGGFGKAASAVYGPVIEVLRRAVEGREHLKVGHHLSMEYEMFYWNLGLRLQCVWDTDLAEKNIYAGLKHFRMKEFWGMENLAARYAGVQLVKDLQTSFDLVSELTQDQLEYCAIDVRLPLGIMGAQRRVAEKDGLTRAIQIDCDSIGAFADIQLHGIGINKEKWEKKVRIAEERRSKILAALDQHFIPVVGSKHISDEDMAQRDAAEKEWRDCEVPTSKYASYITRMDEGEDLTDALALLTPEDLELLDVVRAKRAERAVLRGKFYEVRRFINERIKVAGECPGEAACNYKSQAQLRDALYKMGFKKRELPDTDDRTLKKLAKYPSLDLKSAFETETDLNYPVIDLIRLLRSVDKELDTYGWDWIRDYNYVGEDGKPDPGHLHPITGRIHSRIDGLGAANGRSSSNDPNTQNIPKDDEVRSCFEAAEGNAVITIDYSGCELRILAHQSKDPVLLGAFEKKQDVHCIVSEMMYRDRWHAATEPDCAYVVSKMKCKCSGHNKLRSKAKNMNFGIVNDMGPAKLADEIDVSIDEAKETIGLHRTAIPVATAHLEKSAESAKFTLECRTLAGRRRRWNQPTWETARAKAMEKFKTPEPTTEEIRKTYTGTFAAIGREGRNTPISGSNADLAKRAMYLVWLRLPEFGAFFINMVHDELVVECPKENAEACFEFVSEWMTKAGTEFVDSVEMETEGRIANCWTK